MSSMDTKNNRDETYAALVKGFRWVFDNPDKAIAKYPAMTYDSCDLSFDHVQGLLRKALYSDMADGYPPREEKQDFDNTVAMVWRDVRPYEHNKASTGAIFMYWSGQSICLPDLRFFYYSNAWRTIEIVNDITMGLDISQRNPVHNCLTLNDAMARNLIIYSVGKGVFKCTVWTMQEFSETDLCKLLFDVRCSAIDFCCTAATTRYFDIDFVQDLVMEMPNCTIVKWDQKHIEKQLKSRIGSFTQANKHLSSKLEEARVCRERVLATLKGWIKSANDYLPNKDPMDDVMVIWGPTVFPMSDLESHKASPEVLHLIINRIEDILAIRPIENETKLTMNDTAEALTRRITIAYRTPSFGRRYESNYTFMTATVDDLIHSTAFLLFDEYVRCAYRKLYQ